MELDQKIMLRMGFAASDNGPYVTELRQSIKQQVADGLVNRSGGTWAPEYGPAGMLLPTEERARAFLQMDWEVAQNNHCEMRCLDRPFGWKYNIKADTKHYEIKWRRMPAYFGDRWRSFKLSMRVFYTKRILRRKNPYVMSPELERLLKEAKLAVDRMTPEQKEGMYRKQRDGWVRSEMQWAKDFREGKCERD